jgi:hypothetical protein
VIGLNRIRNVVVTVEHVRGLSDSVYLIAIAIALASDTVAAITTIPKATNSII